MLTVTTVGLAEAEPEAEPLSVEVEFAYPPEDALAVG